MKKFYDKNREMLLYMVFGTVTVMANILTYYVMAKINDNTAIDTAVALFVSVLVAYATNRKFVFRSEHYGARAVFIEFFSFFAFRAVSGIMDIVIMVIFVDIFHYNDMAVKLVSNVFVIIFNFAASKWFIFKNE